jgi:aspartate aminotransferase
MTEILAKRIDQLQESSTLQMARMSRELKAKGLDIINLSLGEPDFDTPMHIKLAAIEAINQNFTHYPPVSGYPELRQAVADKFKRENGLEYPASQVIVSTGAKQSIINVLLSLLQEGDEIIIPAPYWVSYPEMVKMSGAKSVFIPTTIEQDFKISPEQLEKAITPNTKAFIYSNPCNPTGSFYSHGELKGLAEVFARHPKVHIISDEIYEHINYNGGHASLAQFPEIFERCVVVNGVSKAFAMTGFRMGYLAASQKIVTACEKIQGQVTSGACSISQRATITALNGDMTPTYNMCDAFLERRDFIVSRIKSIPGLISNVPQGAFYVFPEASYYFDMQHDGYKINNTEDLSMYLLKEAQVSLVSGSGFGADNHIRLSFAASKDQIDKAIDRIGEALGKLKK